MTPGGQTRARVVVRPPTPADRAEYMAAMRSSRRLHGRWLDAPNDEAFDRLLSRVRDPRYEPMLVCRVEDGAIAGFINISEIVRGGFQSAYLGYGGVAAYAGQGYMREGLDLVLARAFTELGLHRLEANIQPGNQASIALVKRCGFVREGFSERYLKIGGRWRDHERWAIRVEQWRAGRGHRG
jgi:[ribosomal protein S5]-alanine N-acetyltransferase